MKKLLFAILGLISVLALSVSVYASADLSAAISKAVQNCETSLDVSSFNAAPQEVLNEYYNLHNTNPDFAYAGYNVECEYLDNKAITVYFTYNDSVENIRKQKAAVDAEVTKIAESAKSGANDVEKIKLAHNALLTGRTYDNSIQHFTPYELFTTNSGVCTAYAFSFKMVMDKLNIPCEIAYSESMEHEWNVVKADGKWYNADLSYDCTYQEALNTVSITNTLKSDKFFTSTGHYNWITASGINCTDTTYDNLL